MWAPQISQARDEDQRRTNNLIAGLAVHVAAVLNVLVAVACLLTAPVLDVLIGLAIAVAVQVLLVLGIWALIANGF